MKVQSTEISGLKVIELDIWRDSRGFFTERFRADKFQAEGLPFEFVQDNWSRSLPKVLRGLHFQRNPNQGKLVGVTSGTIWDVAIDLRKSSPTYGKYFSVELSGENGRLLWVPGGFAHGFCVLGSEPADVIYKVDCLYNPKTEGGICWNDPALNIAWPVERPLVSEKDQILPQLRDLERAGGLP